MKAITVQQPWAAAIAYLGKDVENRDWPCPKALIGQDVAIHASARLISGVDLRLAWGTVAQLAERSVLERSHLKDVADLQHGCGRVLAVATIAGCYPAEGRYNGGRAPSPIDQSPWFFGDYGFHLTNVRALPTAIGPVKGSLGFWTLPADVESRVRYWLGVAEGARAVDHG